MQSLRRLRARVGREAKDWWVWLPYPVKVRAVLLGVCVLVLLVMNFTLTWPLLVLAVAVGVSSAVRRSRRNWRRRAEGWPHER